MFDISWGKGGETRGGGKATRKFMNQWTGCNSRNHKTENPTPSPPPKNQIWKSKLDADCRLLIMRMAVITESKTRFSSYRPFFFFAGERYGVFYPPLIGKKRALTPLNSFPLLITPPLHSPHPTSPPPPSPTSRPAASSLVPSIGAVAGMPAGVLISFTLSKSRKGFHARFFITIRSIQDRCR